MVISFAHRDAILWAVMGNLHLSAVTRTQGNNRALKDGTVAPSGAVFEFEEVPVLIHAFRRMVRELAYDVCEMALTTYLCAKAHGKRFTALPVFLVRGSTMAPSSTTPGPASERPRTWEAARSASTAGTPSRPACGRGASCRTSTASISIG